MVGTAFVALHVPLAQALLIAFDQHADYDSPNFLWFRDRYNRFVYVDRIIVAADARGQGLARQLYAQLFELAGHAGHVVVTCEINSDPPNPASDAFHAAAGFAEAGRAALANGKTVRYLTRALG
ncbi:GNAT family N-acetyltransferase [Altererythrobacter sp. H2]|uniref:GNAT family N-acetyltransferase n=1 Tax=Altererythrobacter sp. H2 TaxID=3108391 RepID=UPI002B4BEDC6|nr:GNAT family N-acetyltransferase [Altererythrobacter sp. H2]WRK97254.1 GNAT family N-acetyltransferase [Altererythrobacter sp. H2]